MKYIFTLAFAVTIGSLFAQSGYTSVPAKQWQKDTVLNTKAVKINSQGGLVVGTYDLNGNAILELNSTTKGFLPTRLNTTQQNAITSPANGLTIYNTDSNALVRYDAADGWRMYHYGNMGGGGSYTFDNGLTETGGVVELGGDLDNNTTISGRFTGIGTVTQWGTSLPFQIFPGVTIDGQYNLTIDTPSNRADYFIFGKSNALAPIQLGTFNTSTFRNSRLAYDFNVPTGHSNFLLGTNVSAGASDLSYGVEGWTNRREVNFYVTDNSISYDVGRINIGSDSVYSEPHLDAYIIDGSTFSASTTFGINGWAASDTGIVLQYHHSMNGYSYGNNTPSSFIVKDGISLLKPSGVVFNVDSLGTITASNFNRSFSTEAYGSSVVQSPSIGYYTFTSGTGTAFFDLDLTAPIGTEVIIKDGLAQSATNNIIVDSGTGNSIVGSTIAQTYTINTNGASISLKRISSTTWEVF